MARAMRTAALMGAVLGWLGFARPALAAGGCTSNLDCKGGRVCVSGDCVDPPKPCGKDVDCPGDWVCTDHHCGPANVPGSAAPPQTAPGTTAASPRTRDSASCRDGCQAEKSECNDQADSKASTCVNASRDSKHARICAAQSQDEHGQCTEEYSTCISACH